MRFRTRGAASRGALSPPERSGLPGRSGRLGTIGARWALVLAVVPLGLYALPRTVGLIGVPSTLDGAIGHIRGYNPRLSATAGFDRRATAELADLDRVDAALAGLRGTDTTALTHLTTLVGQTRARILPLLSRTDVNVAALNDALDRLHVAVLALRRPVGAAGDVVHDDRARLDRALAVARAVAAQVGVAGQVAQRSADDVSGPGR